MLSDQRKIASPADGFGEVFAQSTGSTDDEHTTHAAVARRRRNKELRRSDRDVQVATY
jgi:hypothetical protein